MKRWICILLSMLLISGSLLSEGRVLAGTLSSDELDRVVSMGLTDTFPTVDGGMVSLCADASKEVTVLIFGQTVCSNTNLLLQSIAKSGWIHDSNVKVIFAEISKANAAMTKHFVKTYGCEEMAACYSVEGGISELMWEYLGTCGSLSLPVVVLLDRQGNVQEILQACFSANELYLAMKKFAAVNGSEEDGKIDQERTLSVSGSESYEEAGKVLRLINQERAKQGVGAVKLDAELTETAMIRAAELSLYYAHVRPCGKDSFSIFRESSAYSENIAIGQKRAQDVMDDWNHSERHHANIIDSRFTSVGVGCFTDNNGMNYWVQCFDNEEAKESVKYGVQKVQRSIPILESHIHLQAITNVYSLSCAEDKRSAQIDIRNINETWETSMPKIEFSDLAFSSSDSQIAEVDENGKITFKAAGSTLVTAALKGAPDINLKLNVSKQAHSYVLAPGQEESGEQKYVCENCGGIQGVKAEIDSNLSVSEGKSNVKIIDSRTKIPLSQVQIWANGEYWTDKNGIAELGQTGLATIQVKKEGYHKKTVRKELNRWQCTVIMLSPNTGNLQVASATLSVAGNDMDVLDHTVSVIDKDLDGETNIIDTDFTLEVEAAGRPVKYQLIQNGKTIKQSTDGKFTLKGHYGNKKNGKVSYYIDDFSAGYEIFVKVYDEQGKTQSQKLGIRVCKGSSFAFKKLEEAEEKGKVDFDLSDGIKVTMPDSVPILGGAELSFGLEKESSLQISIDHNTGLVRIAYNMEDEKGKPEDWDKKKQEYKDLLKKAWKGTKVDDLFGGMPKPFSAGYFSVTGKVCGYGEGYWNEASDSVCVNLGLIVQVKGEEKFEKLGLITIAGAPLPVYVSFKGGADFKTSGEINLSFKEKGFDINGGSLEFNPSIYIEPEAGIGIDGVASYGVYGKIDLNWLYRYLDNYCLVTMNGEAGLKKTFLFAEHKAPILSGSLVLYESRRKSNVRVTRAAKSNSGSLEISGAEFISMDYLSKRAEEKKMGAKLRSQQNPQEAADVRIVDYAYGNASPRLLKAGDKLYLFYLDGVQGRSKQNQTALCYRISSDNGATWSEAFRADGGANETADYNFDIAVADNTIYAVWSDCSKVYGEELLFMDIEDALAKAGKEMDLMLSVIDAETGKVRETSAIGTSEADLQPKIAVGSDGEVLTAWVTNDVSAEDGLLSSENKMGVSYASSKDNFEVHSCPLAQEFYPIALDVGSLGAELCVAINLDTDADVNTQEDREIYCLKTGGVLSRQTSDSLEDSFPVFGSLSGENCLFWHQDGNIAYTADGETVSHVFGGEEPYSVGQRFSLLEGDGSNASIVWTAASVKEDKGVDVYSTDFDGNGWSAPYRLGTLDSEYRDAVDGCLDGSQHQIVYLGSVQEEEGLVSHISLYRPEERIDTSIAWDAQESKTSGEIYPLRMIVTNNGNKEVTQLSIVSEDNSIRSVVTGFSIAPGTSEEIVWNDMRLPEEMTEPYNVKLTIAADGETDIKENQIDLTVGEPDLSVEAYQDFSSGEQFASVLVTNHGIVPCDAVLNVYKDEEHTEQLYQTKIPQLRGGESRITLFDLTVLAPKTQTFYFEVTDSGNMELYTEDNQAVLYIGRGIYLDYENGSDIGGEDVKPTTNYEYELNEDKRTITITKCTSTAVDIAIPSEIDGHTVTGIGDKAFCNVTSMKTVSFPSTLKSIGNYAFEGCVSLTSVTLPDSLTGLYTYVFKGCTSLKSVKLNAGRINITEGLFQGCISLGSVTVPNSVQYIRPYAFHGCTSLKTLSLPKSLLVIYEYAFLNCGISSVKYAGTSADWKKITISTTGNSAFLNSIVTSSGGKAFSANKNKWNTSKTPQTVKKPSVSVVKSFKAKAGRKKLTLSWKKLSGAAGYQLQISTKKNFKGAKKISVSKVKKSYTKKRLKAKKKYYIRIRAYKTYTNVQGKKLKVYGKWKTISRKTK